MSSFENASLNLRSQTAALGDRGSTGTAPALGAAELGVLGKVHRGQRLTPGEQAIAHAARAKLAAIYNGARAPGRMATPTPTTSTERVRGYDRSVIELERLKRRHAQHREQTINGQVVAPLPVLKTPPPAKLYVPSAHR